MSTRIVSWFSCGAASAVATVIAAVKYGGIEAVYCRVKEEHPDNMRFMEDFTKTFGIPVKIIGNIEYDTSAQEVFTRVKYFKNKYGAPCTVALKKEVRRKYQRPNDIQVFGYTAEEQDRADRFIDSNNDVQEYFPLLLNGVTKQDCYRLIRQAGITLPMMYRLGYGNNNCIGCVKGGMGYWNKIRVDFPDTFAKMSNLERKLNFSICKDKHGSVFLDELDPARGNPIKDAPADCGFTCEVQTG